MNEREKTEKGREQRAPVSTKLEPGFILSFPGWDAWKRDFKEWGPSGSCCLQWRGAARRVFGAGTFPVLAASPGRVWQLPRACCLEPRRSLQIEILVSITKMQAWGSTASRNTKKSNLQEEKQVLSLSWAGVPSPQEMLQGLDWGPLPHSTPKYLPSSGVPWDRLPREVAQSPSL